MTQFLLKVTRTRVYKVFLVLMLLFDFYFFAFVMPRMVRTYLVSERIRGGGQTISLPAPVFYGEYDYCTMRETTRDSDKALQGTPIPFEPLAIGITDVPTEEWVSPPNPNYPFDNTPTPVPLPTTTPEPEIIPPKLEVVTVGVFNPQNYHFVLVGIGYDSEENGPALTNLIQKLRSNFAGVNIDFSYVVTPMDAELEHVIQNVRFADSFEQRRILSQVEASFPADGIFFAVESVDLVGTSHGEFAIITATDPNSVIYASHEMGHQLGLGDGYSDGGTAFYSEGQLPSSELFYLDEMPYYLAEALKLVDEIPPLFEMGTCRGKKVYQFYEPNFNIMSDNGNYLDPKPWGSVFTPLQIIEMNLFIEDLK
jgi:hypothetical protein